MPCSQGTGLWLETCLFEIASTVKLLQPGSDLVCPYNCTNNPLFLSVFQKSDHGNY